MQPASVIEVWILTPTHPAFVYGADPPTHLPTYLSTHRTCSAPEGCNWYFCCHCCAKQSASKEGFNECPNKTCSLHKTGSGRPACYRYLSVDYLGLLRKAVLVRAHAAGMAIRNTYRGAGIGLTFLRPVVVNWWLSIEHSCKRDSVRRHCLCS